MKKTYLLIIIALIFVGAAWYFYSGRYRQIDQLEIPGSTVMTASMTEIPGMSAGGEMVYYKGFSLSFNNQTHQAKRGKSRTLI